MAITFTCKVYKRKRTADFISRETFLEEVLAADALGTCPRDITHDMLNTLEYFGLLLPAAKVLAPMGCAVGASMTSLGWKTTSPCSWAIWEFENKTYMMQVPVRQRGNKPPLYKKEISGKIVWPTDVAYWKAMRGLCIGKIESWKRTYPDIYDQYKQKLFEIPLDMVCNGNLALNNNQTSVIPMFRREDIEKCTNLLSFFHHPLPLAYSILAFAETQKRTRQPRPKVKVSQELKDALWRSVTSQIANAIKNYGGQYPRAPQDTPTFTFHRDNHINAFIHTKRKAGLAVTEACYKVAEVLLHANPDGEEPLDPETIRKNIYNSNFPKSL